MPGPARPPAVTASVPAPADHRMAAYQELASRHGLRAEPGEYDGEILIRSPQAPPGRFALTHERPGEPILNENGRIIPLPRASAYLAAYAAAPDTSPDQLYAQAAADPVAAAGEHAVPQRDSDQAVAGAAARARQTGTAHHLYRDGMALVSTAREPASWPYYTVTPDGRWSRVAGHLAAQRQRARSATPPLPDRRPWQSSRPARGQHSRAGPTRHRHPGRGPARAAGNL